MNAEQAAALRQPFEPAQIGKLPRAATKAAKEADRKGNCDVCGKYHVLPAIHLDYVGHAAVTDRLLAVDPEWSWRPMAFGEHGEPLIVNGGLWIELTICGVTRPGFGDASDDRGMKEMIGDAIRNAAMRFGVALDLWAKEDLHASAGEPSTASTAADADTDGQRAATASSPADNPAEAARRAQEARQGPTDGGKPSAVVIHWGPNKDRQLGDLTPAQVKWLAETWSPKPEFENAQDRRLKMAAILLNKGEDIPDWEIPF